MASVRLFSLAALGMGAFSSCSAGEIARPAPDRGAELSAPIATLTIPAPPAPAPAAPPEPAPEKVVVASEALPGDAPSNPGPTGLAGPEQLPADDDASDEDGDGDEEEPSPSSLRELEP